MNSAPLETVINLLGEPDAGDALERCRVTNTEGEVYIRRRVVGWKCGCTAYEPLHDEAAAAGVISGGRFAPCRMHAGSNP